MKKRSKKKKKTGLLIAISFLVVLALATGGYYFATRYIDANKLKVTFNNNKKAEINSESIYSDYILEVLNGTLTNGDTVIDTSKLGKKELAYVFKNKQDEEERIHFEVEIVDTEVPVIEAKKELSSYVTKDIDLLKDVKVTDNSNEEIKATVVGDYDKNKAGKYDLKYEAKDSSGNKAEFDFTLNIISDPNNRTFTTSKGFSGKVVDGVTYIDGVLIANKTYKLPSNYGNGLTWETQNAFNKMREAAVKEGLNIWISSGYRSYWDQNYIYNNYVSRDGQAAADRYSARAGHSEHQTGLAFDLNSIDDSFTYTEEGKWTKDHCYNYGLILRYPQGKESITGYMHESWHFRYVGVELATKLYNNGDWITLEEYYGIDSKYS